MCCRSDIFVGARYRDGSRVCESTRPPSLHSDSGGNYYLMCRACKKYLVVHGLCKLHSNQCSMYI